MICVMKVIQVHQLKVLQIIIVINLSLIYYIKRIFLVEKLKILVEKWNEDISDRLNVLIDKIKEKQNSKARKIFEQELYQKYVLQADANMAQLARNKRKREMKDIENMEKKFIV